MRANTVLTRLTPRLLLLRRPLYELAGRLVLETYGHDDVVAFFNLRLYRLEHIIVGACKCMDREAHRHRKGNGYGQQFRVHIANSSEWMIAGRVRRSLQTKSRYRFTLKMSL